MNRRDVIKLAGLAALATTYASAYEEKLIVNKKDMALKDPANPSDFEYKHMPEITLGDVDAQGYTLVQVSVGQKGIIHPSVDNHWIYEIELYVDGKEISSVELEPTTSRGYLATRINVKNAKEIKAVAKCNLHGNYTSSITL